ncbi:MAG: disulfide bond formation protein DsbA [Parcubacteria group bacterium]|jgi:protein-disulfide isomerase|nr:disulfide bond formation protein DsbA [Parcubacteria group bacterium]|tara:strand:- start:19420 stop:20196 length:777 start_codon:yes stop_codon:yes gene_type:complete
MTLIINNFFNFMSQAESKRSLLLGLFIGIAAVSSVGFLSLLFNGGSLPSIGGSQNEVVANTNTAPSPSPSPSAPTPAAPSPSGNFSQVSAVTDEDHIRGNKNAKVTLIEFSDFECPFCARLHPTLQQLLSQYENDIRIVYRHFPLNSIHPNAQKAAEASECAGEQGKFWEYHDTLLDNQQAMTVPSLKSYAGQLGLSQTQFDSCLDSNKYASKVNQQLQEGQAAGVTGTPGTFVNGELVRGAYPIATFQQIIDGILAN